MTSTPKKIGIVGLGPMGKGYALNLLDKGVDVLGWDINRQDDQPVPVASSLENLANRLPDQKCIILFLPNGQAIDDAIASLLPLLKAGDILVDCGNSYFKDTLRRQKSLSAHNIHFLGTGVSGGPAGAQSGPAMMVSGEFSAWKILHPIFESTAAGFGTSPCCAHFGNTAQGHFVKMVHNGIEYGIMQLLVEAYSMLKFMHGDTPEEIAAIFKRLNSGNTESYLTEITAKVIPTKTENEYLLDLIDDKAEQKGTGRWTAISALELGIAVPTITEAVTARTLSSYPIPSRKQPIANKTETEPNIQSALALAFASCFIQGLSMLPAAKELFDEAPSIEKSLFVWRNGCILRGSMTSLLLESYTDDMTTVDMLAQPAINKLIEDGLKPLRQLCSAAIENGITIPALTSALSYVESFQGSPRSSNLLQLQRNYFGRHPLKDKQTGNSFQGPWHTDG